MPLGTNGYSSLESVLQSAIKDPVKVDIWALGALVSIPLKLNKYLTGNLAKQ